MADIFLLKKPWITEKSTDLSKGGKYVFVVKSGAKKPEIKKAVKEVYKVDAVAVNIINKPPKSKRMGALKGSQAGYKKAIVTLKEGQKIEVGQ
jgi:large subunit ribosomal protein L23